MPQIDDDLLARVKALLNSLDDVQVPRLYSSEARALKALLDTPVDADLAAGREWMGSYSGFSPHDAAAGKYDSGHTMAAWLAASKRARKLEAEECARIIRDLGAITNQRFTHSASVEISDAEAAIRQRSADHGS